MLAIIVPVVTPVWWQSSTSYMSMVITPPTGHSCASPPLVRPTAVTALGGSLVGRQLSRQRAFVGAVCQKVIRRTGLQPFFSGRWRDEFIDKRCNNHRRIVAYGVLNCATRTPGPKNLSHAKK